MRARKPCFRRRGMRLGCHVRLGIGINLTQYITGMHIDQAYRMYYHMILPRYVQRNT